MIFSRYDSFLLLVLFPLLLPQIAGQGEPILETTTRKFEVEQLLYVNLFKASSAFLDEQCAGSTIIHRGYGVCRGNLGIHVIPHAAIFHDGVQCGTGAKNEYMLVAPWRHVRTAQVAQANQLLAFYNILKSNSRASNAMDLIEDVDPIHFGLEYRGPRVCGSVSFPNNTIYIFVNPTPGNTDIDFQVAYLQQSEIGMLSFRPNRELCIYKQTRHLGENQPSLRTPTPTPSPFADPINLNESSFDFENSPGVPTLFPVTKFDTSQPSPSPTLSVGVMGAPSVSASVSAMASISFSTGAVMTAGTTVMASSSVITAPGSRAPMQSPAMSPPESSENPNRTDNVCFPSDAKVIREGWATILMHDVQIGHRVLVQGGKFSSVIMASHNDTTAWTPFIALQTTRGFTLTLSASHYIPTTNGLRTAAEIAIGDSVTLWNGDTDFVVSKETRWKFGLHNPHTIDGTIVVDGVLASTFTSTFRPAAANALLAPIKYMFRLGFRLDILSHWLAKGHWNLLPWKQ